MASFGKFLADRDDLSRSDRRILKFIFRRDVPLAKRKLVKDAETAAKETPTSTDSQPDAEPHTA
jgi:hypothetical protein